MFKEKAFLLADKLESRGYRQGNGSLRIGPRTFCCLGVACQVAGVKVEKGEEAGFIFYSYDGEHSYLPNSTMDFFDFHDRYGKRRDRKRILIDGRKYVSLADANDGGVSFKKIAKYIRENYKDL